jgi:acyl carrier protein
MEFIGSVEEKYGVEFDLDQFEFEQFNTLQSIVEVVSKLIGAKS